MERNNIHLDIFNYIAKPTKNFIAEKNAGYQSNVSFLYLSKKDGKFLFSKLGFPLDRKIVKKQFLDETDAAGEYYGGNEMSFQREYDILQMLYKIPHFPWILSSDTEHKILYTTFNGTPLTPKNVPKDWKNQLRIIFDTLHSLHIFHNDVRVRNFLVHKQQLYLIDFGWAGDSISYPYMNINMEQIEASDNIFNLFHTVKRRGQKLLAQRLTQNKLKHPQNKDFPSFHENV